MKFIDKFLDLINDKVLMIFLEICLMLNNIALNRPVLVAIWLVCIFLSIINLALDDKEENKETNHESNM